MPGVDPDSFIFFVCVSPESQCGWCTFTRVHLSSCPFDVMRWLQHHRDSNGRRLVSGRHHSYTHHAAAVCAQHRTSSRDEFQRMGHHTRHPLPTPASAAVFKRHGTFHGIKLQKMASNTEQRLLALEQGLLRVAALEQSHSQIAQLHDMVSTLNARSLLLKSGPTLSNRFKHS